MSTVTYRGKRLIVLGSFNDFGSKNYIVSMNDKFRILQHKIHNDETSPLISMFTIDKRRANGDKLVAIATMVSRASGDLYANSPFILVYEYALGYKIVHKKYNASELNLYSDGRDLRIAIQMSLDEGSFELKQRVLTHLLLNCIILDNKHQTKEYPMSDKQRNNAQSAVDVEFEIANDMFVADPDLDKLIDAFGDDIKTGDCPVFYEASYDLTAGATGLKNYFIVLNPSVVNSMIRTGALFATDHGHFVQFGRIPGHGIDSVGSLIVDAVKKKYGNNVIINNWNIVPIFGSMEMTEFSKELKSESWYGR